MSPLNEYVHDNKYLLLRGYSSQYNNTTYNNYSILIYNKKIDLYGVVYCESMTGILRVKWKLRNWRMNHIKLKELLLKNVTS